MNSGKLTESINASRKAIQLNPQLVESYCNLGMALQESMQLDQALTAYNNALMLQPQHPAAQSNRLMCMQYVMKFGSKELREAAASFDLGIEPIAPQASKSPRQGKKIRIGYVSADFNRHPIGWFFQEILKKQDRENFETFCYYSGNQCDEITDILRQQSDTWHAINKLTDREVAARILSDHIDILVDLGGHTAGNRLGVFQYRPAPIQISWLGYFASTGLKAMDYVFISKDQIAAGSQRYFSEKLFLLEHCQFCYSPPDYCPPVAPSPHLQNGFIRFACFNNTAKLNSDLLFLWCQILRDVPGSRLLLKWKSFSDNTVFAFVKDYCQRLGIGHDRIELRGASDHKSMLEEYSDVDIALDPFPFSGALTTCESLWMGVPVVSMAQLRPVSRQSFSILKNNGLEELAASSADEYRSIAVALAGDSQKLVLLRSTLRQNMDRHRDSHAAGLTAELERGFYMIKDTN
jgi:predicted O-linked N-acetylglucosamine transferase (SPINDLY family)